MSVYRTWSPDWGGRLARRATRVLQIRADRDARVTPRVFGVQRMMRARPAMATRRRMRSRPGIPAAQGHAGCRDSGALRLVEGKLARSCGTPHILLFDPLPVIDPDQAARPRDRLDDVVEGDDRRQADGQPRAPDQRGPG